LTKHGFLDKIKTAAKSKDVGESVDGSNKRKKEDRNDKSKKDDQTSKPAWGALKDDYMLNSKKVRKIWLLLSCIILLFLLFTVSHHISLGDSLIELG
jgi:hypothetical protein